MLISHLIIVHHLFNISGLTYDTFFSFLNFKKIMKWQSLLVMFFRLVCLNMFRCVLDAFQLYIIFLLFFCYHAVFPYNFQYVLMRLACFSTIFQIHFHHHIYLQEKRYLTNERKCLTFFSISLL